MFCHIANFKKVLDIWYWIIHIQDECLLQNTIGRCYEEGTNIKKILYGLIMWFESEKSFCRFFVDSSKQWRCTKSWMMAIVILLLITVLYTSIIYLIMFLVVRASSQQLLMLWFVLTTSMYNYLHWPVHLNGSHPTFTAFYGNVDIKWICWGPTVIIWIM